ncbi:uncharacterized protein METZ01_LOCUS358715 [marine metagenome]|uniref:Uncharacterized protein n=1 Tax=marine metagenome TaxID=408172 RepID=A0A382SA95_9ZZZZ
MTVKQCEFIENILKSLQLLFDWLVVMKRNFLV